MGPRTICPLTSVQRLVHYSLLSGVVGLNGGFGSQMLNDHEVSLTITCTRGLEEPGRVAPGPRTLRGHEPSESSLFIELDLFRLVPNTMQGRRCECASGREGRGGSYFLYLSLSFPSSHISKGG